MEEAKSQVGPRGISQIAIPLCLPHNSNLTLAHSLELEREKGGGHFEREKIILLSIFE